MDVADAYSGESFLEAVVIPLKAFHNAKSRLRDDIGASTTSDLARTLAERVLEASLPRTRIVVSDDDQVLEFAESKGALAFRTVLTTLNGSISDAYNRLAGSYQQLIVVHGDLARPEGLGTAPFPENITIFTDHHGTGTNVMILPTGLDFRFAYGPSSAQEHQREAARLGVSCQVILDSPWQFDVDEPDDIRYLEGQ
jgi:2-phospho-L-lactate guanylyltransferase